MNEINKKIEEILDRKPIGDGFHTWKYMEEAERERKIDDLTTLYTEMVEGELKRFVAWAKVKTHGFTVIPDTEDYLKQYLLERNSDGE